MTVLVIDTGGTIGMVPTAAGWAPSPGELEAATDGLSGFDRALEWLSFSPLLDSSAIGVEEWNRLAGEIAAAEHRVDGVIVVHGTDTLAYTASALSFLLSDVAVPVVLTGSQRPLRADESDGWANLRQARSMVDEVPPGVWVAINGERFPGAHVTKADAVGLAVMTAPFGTVPAADRISPPTRPALPIAPQPVFLHHFLPGAPAAALQALVDATPRVLILRTFGAGNIGLSDADHAALRQARDQGVLLVNHSQCLRADVDMTRYAAAEPLRQLGVVGSGTMTLEALYTKVLVLLSQKDDWGNAALAEALLTPWHFELPAAV